MQTLKQVGHKIIDLTEKERHFLVAVLKYELNLVVQLPDRKEIGPDLERWLDRFENGRDYIDLNYDRVGKTSARGEFLVDIDEFRLFHTYNADDWRKTEMRVYSHLRHKLDGSQKRYAHRFRMEAE